jgi:Formate/nitrite family of transporters
VAQTAREELGETDAPVEDQVVRAFDKIVDEGAQRLHRSWREVLTTGLAGGLEVATGVVALLAVYAATGSHLLAGLAFSIGFIALMLAKSELFTEGFLVPVTAVVAGRAGVGQLGSCGAGRWSPTWSAAGWSCGWSCTPSPSSAPRRSSRAAPSSRPRWAWRRSAWRCWPAPSSR